MIVRLELVLAFQFYWTSYAASASRLRASLERLMDYFGVAKTTVRKGGTDANGKKLAGKKMPLDLSARIDKLPKKSGTKDYSEMPHALRVVGNTSALGAKVSKEAMFDTFQLYEIALNQCFQDESQSAKAIVKRLKAATTSN